MRLETPFLRYVYRNIGIVTFLLFITFCFVCFYILADSRPEIVVNAISDFGVYDETKWIFVAMCFSTGIGCLILFKEILIELLLGKNILLNIIAVLICASFIGLSLTPHNYFSTQHTLFALAVMGGFGVFLFLLALVKKFRGKYILFSGLLGVTDILFILFAFSYFVKVSGGWFLPEMIVLGIMGLWIFVTEMYLGERANRKI